MPWHDGLTVNNILQDRVYFSLINNKNVFLIFKVNMRRGKMHMGLSHGASIGNTGQCWLDMIFLNGFGLSNISVYLLYVWS